MNPWVVEKNETLSLETPSLPPSTLEVVFNCCQFTRKDTDVAISFSLQTFTACTGYQENRMINQIGFVQKLKGFYMNTYLRGKEKC